MRFAEVYFEIATTELAWKIISDTINNYIGYVKSMKRRVPKIIYSCSLADAKHSHINQIVFHPRSKLIVYPFLTYMY